MRKLSLILLITFAFAQKSVIIQDVWKYYRFFPVYSAGSFKWSAKEPYILEKSPEGNIVKANILKPDAKPVVLFNKKDFPEITAIAGFSASKDEKFLLMHNNKEKIYRHSYKAAYFLYDVKNKKLHKIMNGEKIRDVMFSPDNKWVSFTFENNLYIQSTENPDNVIQITKDGKINEIINGHSDWVYEEELGIIRTYEWSPNSKYIAFIRFDESEVKEFTMMTYKGKLYPEPVKFKYPKAGEKNSVVSLHLYKLDKNTSYQLVLPTQNTDIYIPRIKWLPTGEDLAYLYLNRLQNKVELWVHNIPTKNDKKIFTETGDTYLQLDSQTWFFLPENSGFLWRSEKDGFYHIYHYDWNGKLVKQITSGNYEITKIYGFDPKKQYIYYESTEISPLERHIYRIKLDGTNKTLLTKNNGNHSANFSPNYKYWIHTYSDDLVPPIITLEDLNKLKVIDTLVKNEHTASLLKSYEISPKEYFKIPLQSGDSLNAWMIKPANFDANKKYPVLMFVYGGPGSQTVKKGYDPFDFFWYQYLASKGYIIVSVDNRGTGARGRDFRTITYKQLGKIEAEDQAEAAKYLQKLSYVNPKRIGIWGWSFGGYLTTLCMVKFPNIFKVGIAVAPVTNWRFYDTIYTERFLQTPQLNPEGYDNNSPINFVENLAGKYMVAHGSADDNVHLQNTMELINQFIKNDKDFKLLIYPDQNHSIFGYNTRFHLFTEISNFIFQNL